MSNTESKNKQYQNFKNQLEKIADLRYSLSVMSWDMEVNMPPEGSQYRGRQISTIEGLAHQMFTEEQFGKLLSDLKTGDDLSDIERTNVKQTFKSYEKATRFDYDFVVKRSKAVSAAYSAWVKARANDDFSIFETPLKELVDIKRKEAEILGYEDHPYDALMDEYEPNAKTSEIDKLFGDLKPRLKELLDKIEARPQVNDEFMRQYFNKEDQWQFGLDILKQIGYDFDRGRQDLSPHPFTTSFSPGDIRVTTRVDENNFNEMLWSCIHEGGHALYEQGLRSDQYGMPVGAAISLGVHESQSRLYENNLGRSFPFWKANYPQLKDTFKSQLADVSARDFYMAMNKVQPSLIRVEADELTYHFHIMIRYEIEKALIEGSIDVADLPAVWNAKYKEYLGVDVPNNAKGVLQDIHWAHGSFGYFATYSLGSLYAAQYFKQAKKEIPNLEAEIEAGKMDSLLTWLRDKIHQHGQMYTADELCKSITGKSLDAQEFMDYANEKYKDIYSI